MYANQEVQFSPVVGSNHSYGFGPFTTPSPSTPPLSTPYTYVSYRQSYIDKKPYKCNVCRKRFTLRAYLKKHELAPELGKHFICVFCCKAFPERDKLKIHERTHTGERPFACDICPMAFARKDKLKNHARTHSGEKPFVCHICPKAFSRNDKLKIHQRTHSGEKPFCCQICTKAFSRKDHLNKHERTHTNHYSCSQTIHPHDKTNMTSVLSNAKCGNLLKKEFLHGDNRHDISRHLTPVSADELCKTIPISGLNTPVLMNAAGVSSAQHHSYQVASVSSSSHQPASATSTSKTTTLLKQPVLTTLNLDNIASSLCSHQKSVSQPQRSTTTSASIASAAHQQPPQQQQQQQQQQMPSQAHYDWKRNSSPASSWTWNGCPSTLTIPSYTVGQRKGDNQGSSDNNIQSLM